MVTDTSKLTTTSWQHQRNSIGGVLIGREDVRQSIRTICTTQKGSVPFAPEFGCDLLPAIDENPAVSIQNLKVIYLKEIPKQEPRCEVIDVNGVYDDDGQLQMTINYKLKGNELGDKVEVYV